MLESLRQVKTFDRDRIELPKKDMLQIATYLMKRKKR